MWKRLIFVLMLILVLTLSACKSEPAVESIKIIWAQWDPADYLQQIGNKYEEETGIKVEIVQEPWGSFQDRVWLSPVVSVRQEGF